MVITMHQWGLPEEARWWAKTFDVYEEEKQEWREEEWMENHEEDTEDAEVESTTDTTDETGTGVLSDTEVKADDEEDVIVLD